MSCTGLNAFLQLAREHTLVPVSREVIADLETPVAAFWKLREGPASFLLESVEGGEAFARYTLLGSQPRRLLRVQGHELKVTELTTQGDALREETLDGASHPFGPLGLLLDRYQGHQVAPGIDERGEATQLPRFYGGLVGAIAYDAIRHIESIGKAPSPGAPELLFLETCQLLAWDNLKHRAQLVELIATEGLDEAALKEAWSAAIARFDEAQRKLLAPLPPLPVSSGNANTEEVSTLSDESFKDLVVKAKSYIEAGDIIQVVLSRRFTQARAGLHPFLVYRALRAINPSPYMFYLELPELTLVGASPELLVRSEPATSQKPGKAEVRPIAGTRQRGKDTQEDAALAAELKADPKEVAEHIMLVDLGRNDLGRLAPQVPSHAGRAPVSVDELMVVERYSHVMHLVSHVSATLRPDIAPSEVLAATFPAGTLSGAPKIRAMQLIDELEAQPRGFYGGAIGTLGVNGILDLAIAIRTLVADPEQFHVQAGAGVVWDSDPQAEADETRKKARAVLHAIESARRLFSPALRQGA